MGPAYIVRVRAAFAGAVLLALLSAPLTTTCGGSRDSGGGGGMQGLALQALYERFTHAPVAVELWVYSSRLDEGSCTMNWGDSDTWDPLPTHWLDWDLYGGHIGHTYEQDGAYVITARASRQKKPMTSLIVVKVGPTIRSYTDPTSGSTYNIMDGLAVVVLADPGHLDDRGGYVTWDETVRSFLLAERLTVHEVLKEEASLVVILPDETTVEEAVAEWPQRYPELIESVEPNSISEPM